MMITECCERLVPDEYVKAVIMPCGKCYICCDHLHVCGHTFKRGTPLKEAFELILAGE